MFYGSLLAATALAVTGERLYIDIQNQVPLQPQEDTVHKTIGDLAHVRKELHKAQIIPTVIDDFHPSLALTAKWSSEAHATLGNTIKPKQLQDAPTVSLTGSKSLSSPDMTYVITLTDPDAPSRDDPKWSEMCHWIATGLATSEAVGDRDDGHYNIVIHELEDIMPYKPPGPPEKTGKHRYVFLAFAPKNGTSDPLHLSKPSDRQHWGGGKEGYGVRNWAQDNGLIPVAANFIYAQNKKQ